jgi:HPt (histidine-containing phosphotransfer) domain-containing protein
MSETIIDLSTFESLREIGDPDFIRELIDTFLEDAPHMLNDMSQAMADNNAELFRRSAHSLKTNANTFGALALADLAKKFEDLGRDNQLDAVGDKFDELSAEYARVASTLKGMRNA